jgi:leader peptidase (prepilin peptidase)/N-methyltransferase
MAGMVILFVFGAIVGSFLNVVGLRLNSGLTLGGRSRCGACGKKLRWWELVPILSFFILRGRCSKCRAKISWQYPGIEVLTGLIFATLYLIFGLTIYYLLSTLVFCTYIVIVIYDLRHKIIPDSLVYVAILLSVVGRWLSGGSVLDWLAGPIMFGFFAAIWLISRGRAMGFGDAKLSLSIGLLLGAAKGFSAIVLSFWIGALFGLGYMIFSSKKITMKSGARITFKSELPFAPFMLLGAWLGLIWNLDLLHVSLF